ncbi:hypothetical protein ACC709_37280, partial [Rhizobium ruizarguesonis]
SLEKISAFQLFRQHFELQPLLFHFSQAGAQFFHLAGKPVEGSLFLDSSVCRPAAYGAVRKPGILPIAMETRKSHMSR